MHNPFEVIVAEAAANNWCVKPFCTTCGSREFRSALRQLGGPLGGPLCDALSALSPHRLTNLANWDGALEVAVRDLPIAAQVEAVLDAWLQRAGQNRRFDDVVLFRIVRSLSSQSAVRQRWVQAIVPLAIVERDFSLIESLLLVLKREAIQYPGLVSVADELARGSAQMRRVLRNTCGANPA